jgi:hypothetical protein
MPDYATNTKRKPPIGEKLKSGSTVMDGFEKSIEEDERSDTEKSNKQTVKSNLAFFLLFIIEEPVVKLLIVRLA